MKLATTLLFVAAAVLPTCAQQQTGESGGKTAKAAVAFPPGLATSKRTFDAASVRPSSRKFVLIGTDFLDPVSEQAPPKGGLFSWNLQIGWLIDFAYDVRTPQMGRGVWEALPKWAHEDWYTIEARAEGNPTRADVRQMVRSLLEERFQFSGHVEKRQGQVYALVVDKPGRGLKSHPEGAVCQLSPSQMDEHTYSHAYPSYKQYPAHCGMFNRELSGIGERRFEMLNLTMQKIADSLASSLSLSVVDQTGLTGRYDAVLDFGPEEVPPSAASAYQLGLPPLPAALDKQLGLKLIKQNAQVDVFVIDHIGTLSEN